MFTIPMRKSIREVNKFEFKSRQMVHMEYSLKPYNIVLTICKKNDPLTIKLYKQRFLGWRTLRSHHHESELVVTC
jgi:hypothetical protein